MPDIKLIGVEPSDKSIDLSQAHSLQPGAIQTGDGSFGYSGDPLFNFDTRAVRDQEVKSQLNGVLSELWREVYVPRIVRVLEDYEARLNNRLEAIQEIFNDIDARIIKNNEYITEVRTGLASFLRLSLAGEKMTDEERATHYQIVSDLIRDTASLTIQTDDIQTAKETV